MKKIDLAYKLTADIFKYYTVESLEEKYNTYGGRLATTIFNEIFDNISVTDENAPVIFLGEESIPE